MTDPVELTQALVRCPSVTPLDEGAQQVLIDALEQLGFTCHTLVFGEVTNLFARLGSGAPHICYCGHTDVVPAGDENSWTYPPFAAEIHDGILYGRGTADMKANNACFVSAVKKFLENNKDFDGSISLLITGDEEGPAVNGTVKVLEWMQENGHVPDVALVGEPSNPKALGDAIKIGRRGSLSGFITVKGKQGHSAYPHLADNPLPKLVTLLDALASYEFDNGTEFFPATNLELTSIDVGNPASNVIPEKGSAIFNVRFNDSWSAKTLETRIREILDGTDLKYDLQCESNAESFMTQPGEFTSLVANAVEKITGRMPELKTDGGTSDARFVTNYCPVVECGLINASIHQVDEHCAVDDVYKLTDIYTEILSGYFSG